MSQPSAAARASWARSSPRCQLWTSLPRFPSGFSRLWSSPATKPSSEIDMWQVVSGICVLQVIVICKRRHSTLRVRAELLADGGPALWEDFMAELRTEHLGAPPPTGGGPSATKRLAAAYAEAVAREEAEGIPGYRFTAQAGVSLTALRDCRGGRKVRALSQ